MNIEILELDSVDSTNTYARRHFAGLPDGTLVVSRHQTAGRGRLGRVWVSPPGVNIYGSLVIKNPGEPFLAGALCALAIMEALQSAAPAVDAYVKWPNDVYVGNRKIAGILCESTEIAAGRVAGMVAGMGVNINLAPEELARIDQPATSLLAETGRTYDLKKMTERLVKSLSRYYIIYSGFPDRLFDAWKAANRLIGRRLDFIRSGGECLTGRFADITRDGNLLLEKDGEQYKFNCGEIRISKTSLSADQIIKQQEGRRNE